MSFNKILLVFLAAAMIGCAVRAKADIVDPNSDITDPVCPTAFTNPSMCPNPVYGFTFTITVSPDKGGITPLTNESGVTWTTLSLTETGIAAGGIVCSFKEVDEAYTNCSVTPSDPSDPGSTTKPVTILYFDAGCDTQFCGISYGDELTINLNNPCPGSTSGLPCDTGDTGGWDGVTSLTGTANAVPEPSTMVLLATGAVGVLTRRYRIFRK